MSREIKFRIWNGEEMQKPCDTFMVATSGQIYNCGLNVTEIYTLMQYTGLKDKNGVEIYEGDIVRKLKINNEKEITGVVVYHHLEYTTNPTYDYKINSVLDYTQEIIEVIGNIHENPELLK